MTEISALDLIFLNISLHLLCESHYINTFVWKYIIYSVIVSGGSKGQIMKEVVLQRCTQWVVNFAIRKNCYYEC